MSSMGPPPPRLICRSARRAVTKTSLLTQKMSAFTLAAAAVAEAFTSANGATDTEVRIPFLRFHLRDRDRPSL